MENDALASAMVEAPMVLAEGTRAGLVKLASVLEFPAATYYFDSQREFVDDLVMHPYSNVDSTGYELWIRESG